MHEAHERSPQGHGPINTSFFTEKRSHFGERAIKKRFEREYTILVTLLSLLARRHAAARDGARTIRRRHSHAALYLSPDGLFFPCFFLSIGSSDSPPLHSGKFLSAALA